MKLGARTTSSRQDGAIYLTDLPVHRGMKAAFDELKSLGACEQKRMAYVWRVMDASQFYEHLDRLGDFVKPPPRERMP